MTCLRYLINSRVVTSDFFVHRLPIFLHSCATCSELLSNISRMIQTLYVAGILKNWRLDDLHKCLTLRLSNGKIWIIPFWSENFLIVKQKECIEIVISFTNKFWHFSYHINISKHVDALTAETMEQFQLFDLFKAFA